MESQFATFWNTLNTACPYDLPEEIKPYLQQALKAAGFLDAPKTVIVTSEAPTTVTKTKKLSGYNLFMKEKMAELKAQDIPSGERMTKVSQMWKALTEEQKAEWKNKAGALVPTTVVTTTTQKTTGPKKLSGYQLYVKEIMPTIKETVAAKERMGHIGKMWKGLTEEQKGEWKTKALAL